MAIVRVPFGLTSASGGYTINNAIWLDGSADYLSRIFDTPTNNKKYTMSCWVKYNETSAAEVLALLMTGGGNDYHYICRDTDYKFRILNVVSAVVDWQIDSNAKYRDVAAWGNLVVSIDTTAASGERARAWWNGDEITSFATETEPTASDTGGIINTAAAHYIGFDNKNTTYADCYLAEYIFLDGTAVTDASSFGETDAKGNWVPVDPSGLAFGANGTWLKFDDANDLGKDSSGATTEYDRTPTHSSATAPYNTVSASTETGGSEAWHAFDDVLGWADGWNATATTGWLQYQFDDAKAITSYTITGPTTGDANRAPNTWTLEGSNTGSFSGEETVLDSQSSVSSWGNNETKTYTFSNTTEYAYYRLDVTAINGGTKVGIDQMELREAGNHWHPISIAASQQVEDSPTDSSADNVGNYATLNPLSNLDSSTISNGNLTLVTNSTNYAYVTSTQAMPTNSGIYWFKTTLDSMANGSTNYVGIVTHSASSTTNYLGADADAIGYRADGLTKSNGSNVSTSLTTCTTNDVIFMKVDTDADTVAWYKNDTSTLIVSESIPSGAVGKPLLAAWGDQDNASTAGFTIDFGTGGFSIPDGQYLHTANLPAPTVTDPSAYFQTSLYTGTAATLSITDFTDASGANVTPDFVWIKKRAGGSASSHCLFDVLRGTTKALLSNDTASEYTFGDSLTSFDAGGFTLGADTSSGNVNVSSNTYVAWCLKAGGSGSSNTDGTENSTVSVADHNGFSIVSWTNNATPGTGDTVGHGMGQAPEMLILKSRDDGSDGWHVWHKDLTSIGYYVKLNNTNAEAVDNGNAWDGTAPTSTVFSIGDGDGTNWTNTASHDMIAYCFARTPGLIGIGSYQGNNSASGPHVIVDDGGSGFRPAWLMVKMIDGAGDQWGIFDATRSTYNPIDDQLYADGSDDEATAGKDIDFTANGFKLREAGGITNASQKYIYLAFAEFPFGGSGVAQGKAR